MLTVVGAHGSIFIKMHRVIKSISYKLKDVSKLWLFWKPDYIWLHKNRFLRMDANTSINDKRRRLFHIDRYKFAANYLKDLDKKGLMILDAACGTGYGSDILKETEPNKIIGVDVSSEAIAYASKKYGNNICIFRVADIMNMAGFDNDMFDAVVSFETIEHIEKPLTFLENVKRLLKRGGIFIVSTPNKWGITNDHKFDYDYELLRDHLERYFHIEDIYVQNSGCMELWVNRGAPRRLVKAMPENIEKAECFIAVCKKIKKSLSNSKIK